MKPYPLQFKADYKVLVWGGRALAQFDNELPDGPVGEGWMIADHAKGTSTVINGELAGMGLDQVREQYGEVLFGSKGNTAKNGRFPLLLKLLDSQKDLSIQVHPDDHYEGLPPDELGKTEMWYILDAKPGSHIIYGLNPGVTREQLSEAIEQQRILDCLQRVTVSAGDSFYIPAGTVHALGAGILAVEVQQNSNAVYRLYDYNRPGLDGKPRELHIEHSLNVISFDHAGATRMKTNIEQPNEWLPLTNSSFFVVEKGLVEQQWELSTNPDSFVMIVICEGSGTLSWADGALQAKAGNCFLLPANLGNYVLNGTMTVLRSYLP